MQTTLKYEATIRFKLDNACVSFSIRGFEELNYHKIQLNYQLNFTFHIANCN